MRSIRGWLQSVGFGKREEPLSALAVDTLRTTFQARYHHFKLLLGANNKALEIMGELQEARGGETPFGMYFVNSRCTAVCVNVLRAIDNLNELAPGRYADLYAAFQSIEARIRENIQYAKRSVADDPIIVPLENLDVTQANVAGNKLANLGEIRKRLGIRVPNGFVISSRAYHDFMGVELPAEIDRLMQTCGSDGMADNFQLSTRIQQQIIRSPIPAEIEKAILDAYDDLKQREGQNLRVSVRSSAVGEDSSRTSHAGLYRSELNVSREDLIQAYKGVLASKFSPQAMMYRLSRGVRDDDVDMCVGCMAMVDAVAGGVVYSRNPLDGKDERVHIHSTYGLPVGVVEGNAGEDLWVVGGDPLRIMERHLGLKREKFVSYPEEGIRRVELPAALKPAPSITDATALELAKIAKRIEKHYGCAQDIEWALDEKGEIVILQCRPLGQSEKFAGPKREERDLAAPAVIASGGTTASPGAAAGAVFVVRTESDMLSFPVGAVLVVKQALPRWAAVLSRASAFIAEQGSTAGHLANVAREFGVPGVVGLQDATERLEDGRVVSVDADGGRVCEGIIESLLKLQPEGRKLMEGSPVLDTLNRVVQDISPLNLLDPQALHFRPSACQTLHDITRFCHEKAVLEMFSFGRSHRFSEKSSKQLVCDGVSMQWWVLDLDDGFKADVKGRFVNLDNIASI
ncbi:MAG TPA: PEP/pyruvate-binding domain-containing protein, partial [Acidobacteriaceae bacterium]|nr:PEP/pyruvate-binding domain-containing protein [Acidobacteriaceae bacterium]